MQQQNELREQLIRLQKKQLIIDQYSRRAKFEVKHEFDIQDKVLNIDISCLDKENLLDIKVWKCDSSFFAQTVYYPNLNKPLHFMNTNKSGNNLKIELKFD